MAGDRRGGSNRCPKKHGETLFRLVHAEPIGVGLAAIGLHAFEKRVLDTKGETKAEQDVELEIAKVIYFGGVNVLSRH